MNLFPTIGKLAILIDIWRHTTFDNYFGPNPENTGSNGAWIEVNNHFGTSSNGDKNHKDYG